MDYTQYKNWIEGETNNIMNFAEFKEHAESKRSELEQKEVKFEAICWIPNGKEEFDIWQQKNIEGKDKKVIAGSIYYEYNKKTYGSNYVINLISKIIELKNNQPGFTHLTVWEQGRIKDVIRFSKIDKRTLESEIKDIKNKYHIN